MAKTLLQEKLEHQHGKPIEEVLREVLQSNRGKKGLPILTAVELGISDGTLYWWCRELGIDIAEYRRPAVDAGTQGILDADRGRD